MGLSRRNALFKVFLIFPALLTVTAALAVANERAPSDVELVVVGNTEQWEPRLIAVEREIHSLLDESKTEPGVVVHHHVLSSALPLNRLRSELRGIISSHPNSVQVAFDPFSAQELSGFKTLIAPQAAELSRIVQDDLRSFRKVVPFSSVSVLMDRDFIQGIKGLKNEMNLIQEKLGVRINLEPLPKSESQAVYFSPLFGLSRKESVALIQELNKNRVPTFSSHTAGLIQEGVLAGKINDPEDPSDIRKKRRIALDVQHVVQGTPRAAALALPTNYRLAINRDTARKIGIDLHFDVLANATLLPSSEQAGVSAEALRTPHDIAEEAIQSNLSLAATRFGTQSAQNAVGVARADLLPKADVGLSYFRVNGNLAEASADLIPEHTFAGSAVLRQNLFSEPVLANLNVSTHLAAASQEDSHQVELDVTQAALNAYAQILLVRQQIRQQENNIARTRTNLAVARSKASAGASSQSDVYRWESELASAESSLKSTEANAKISEISLNQILHRPLDQPVSIQELRVDHPDFWVSDPTLKEGFNTAREFQNLENFLVSESLGNSPEIKSINEQVAALERGVFSDRAKFVLPNLSALAVVTHTFATDNPGSLGPSISPVPLSFASLNSTQWALAFNLTYNLFNGLGDLSRLRQDSEKLHQLEVNRSARQEQVEQSLRQAIERARAAYLSIALEETSAKAAAANYELVQKSYIRGARSITDLIDAQNNAFNADVAASTAVYSFFQAYFGMERAIGKFDVMQSDQERREFISRLTLKEKM